MTVKAVYQPRRQKKNGKYINAKDGYIVVRYTHDSKPSYYSTGIKCTPDQFNKEKETYNCTKGVARLKVSASNEQKTDEEKYRENIHAIELRRNKKIRNLKTEIQDIVDELIDKKQVPYIDVVKKKYNDNNSKSQKKKLTIKDYLDLFKKSPIKRGKNKGKLRTDYSIQQYNSAYRRLSDYIKLVNNLGNSEPIYLKYIHRNFYQEFNSYLVDLNLEVNSIGNHFKNLKCFFRWLESQSIYKFPFDAKDLIVGRQKKKIIFLTTDEIDLIRALKLKKDSTLYKVRSVFLLQVNTGMRISDIRRVGYHHILNDEIHLTAHKNQNELFIPISKEAREILNDYTTIGPEGYVLTLPLYSTYHYDRMIKELARQAKLNSTVELIDSKKEYDHLPKWKVLSSHNAVHTFITLTIQKGMSVPDVARITGKSPETILKHYAGTDKERIKTKFFSIFPGEPVLKKA